MRAFIRSIRKKAYQNKQKFLSSVEVKNTFKNEIDLIINDMECRATKGFVFTDGTLYFDSYDKMYDAHSCILNYFMLHGVDITANRIPNDNAVDYFIKF